MQRAQLSGRTGCRGETRTGRILCASDRCCATQLRGLAAQDSDIARTFPVACTEDKRDLMGPHLTPAPGALDSGCQCQTRPMQEHRRGCNRSDQSGHVYPCTAHRKKREHCSTSQGAQRLRRSCAASGERCMDVAGLTCYNPAGAG